MTYSYAPKGVCSSRIDLELEGDIIKSVQPCPAGGTGPGGPLRGWKMPGDAVLRMMKER